MSNPNHLFTDDVALLSAIDPDAYTSSAAPTSAWVHVSPWYNIAALVSVGDFSSSTATVDASFTQGTNSTGGSSKTLSSKSITQFASTSDANKQAWINIKPEELDVANGFDYIQLTVTVASGSTDVATVDAAAYLFGKDAGHGLASASDVSTVDEIVT